MAIFPVAKTIQQLLIWGMGGVKILKVCVEKYNSEKENRKRSKCVA